MERNQHPRQSSNACHPNKLLVLAESASSTLVEEEENGASRLTGAVADVGGLFGIGGYRNSNGGGLCMEDDDVENHDQRRHPPRNSNGYSSIRGRRCYRGSDLFDNDEDDDNEALSKRPTHSQQKGRRQQRGDRGEQENDDTVNLMTDYRDLTFVGCGLPNTNATTRRRGSSKSKKDPNRRKSTGSIHTSGTTGTTTVKSTDLSTLATKKTMATTKATIDAVEAEKKPSKQRVSNSKATSTTSSTSLSALQRSINTATTVQLTGRGGVPVYHSMPISECEVLQPVGRWKYRFKTSNAVKNVATERDNDDDDIGIPLPPTTKQSTATVQPTPPRLSPLRFVETELHIGTVVIDCFRRRDVVTLHSRHESMATSDDFLDNTANTTRKQDSSAIGTLTITIAEPGSNQLAIIALLRHVPLDWCRAVGLHSIGDSARLDHVIHFLYTQQQQETQSMSTQSPMFFQFWSIGIPATLMSHCLYTNLMALPNNKTSNGARTTDRRASFGKQFMCHNDDYEEEDDENIGAAVCRLLPSSATARK